MVVLGAAGGTGLAAIEIGKLLGLRVVACASSDEKLEFCKRYGADILFNYAKDDLKEGLKKIGGAKGIDIVFDPVGGDFTEAALALARLGRPAAGDRLCIRPDPAHSAQPRRC